MATVNVTVLKHHKKKDDTWNVKIRVTHKSRSAYIDTYHYVTREQLKKDFTIKDYFIVDQVNPVLADYRKQISLLGNKLDTMTAKSLAEYLKKSGKQEIVNFSSFCKQYIQRLRDSGKIESASNYQTVLNQLHDFTKHEHILASDITVKFLREFERYLKSPRAMKRRDQYGKLVTIKRPGLTSGLFNYMRDLRVLFNAARNEHNDPDTGIMPIPNYPFQRYQMPVPSATKHRNLPIETIKAIRNYEANPGSRAELGRDMFMLSFYLCGMNSVDIYKMENVGSERLNYCRSKTKGKRRDNGFISIYIPEEARKLIDKHIFRKGVQFISLRYSNQDNFNKAINIGLKKIASDIRVPKLEFYYARHSFASIARNTCRCSKDDVAMAMNHVDQSKKITDIYLANDWSIVDEVQSKVIALLNLHSRDVGPPSGS